MRSTWSRLAKAENQRGFSNKKRCSSTETQSSESQPTLACHSRREMTSPQPAHPSSTSAAIESIKRSLSELYVSADEHCFSFENPRRFSAFANRLQVLFIHQLLRLVQSPDSLPAAATTALKGVAADLSTAILN
jgi:hypothetical protein